MKTNRTIITITTLLLCGMAQSSGAQNVDVRVSAREAYVGMPIVLQVAIENASDYEAPSIPEIDGCEVRSAGSPMQSSQITIINGRRSESRSVTLQYLITPRREGTFEIPTMTINVNGRDQKTKPVRFVASKSETGDLLFVEIEGGKVKVFVGQPLDLTLKIWVKPFVDRENNIKLSEAEMWQMISEQTSWGSFSDRLKELAENGQRPGGKEVLRDDGHGNEREYYQYEIEATVYPKRAGQIDASDVQIVVNYPTGLGKSRDSFESFFGDSPFGGSSMSSRMQQMMGNDFLFGNRLAVTSARPIVGQAAVDSTQVVPVPTEGRPADYRGAVGRYEIVTQAKPTHVSAGDPITLNIGIFGTGPMELVQAPPLSELPSLTADFKVEDQSLAGFVKDETKVFPTTIRPRREGITQIPAIPFSFFDPETEAFHTVVSDPISITVDKAESLALDAIVAKSRRRSAENGEAAPVNKTLEPDFRNDNSASVLKSQAPATTRQWWWGFVILPPLVWLGTLLVRYREAIVGRLPSLRSASGQCLAAIDGAKDRAQIEAAIIRFVSRRTGQTGLTKQSAVGALRSNGLYSIATEVESFFQSSDHSAFSGIGDETIVDAQSQARELVNKVETAFTSMSKSQVRRSTSRQTGANSKAVVRRVTRTAQKASMLLVAGLVAFSLAGETSANETPLVADVAKTLDAANSPVAEVAKTLDTVNSLNLDGFGDSSLQLSESQRQTILKEAGDSYARAIAVVETDSAEANDLFTSAAAKYQLLVDSGIDHSRLYINLGNAYLQSNQLGHAIANYERAKKLDPVNRQLDANLELANSLVKGHASNANASSGSQSADPTSVTSIVNKLRMANYAVVRFVGTHSVIWTLAISSLFFWGLLAVSVLGTFSNRFPLKRIAVLPLLLLILTATSFWLSSTPSGTEYNGIIVANNVTLRSGDGEQFDEVVTIENAQGHRIQTVNNRGDWAYVKTASGHVGWIKATDFQGIAK